MRNCSYFPTFLKHDRQKCANRDPDRRECFCNHQMDVKRCSVQGIFSTSSVLTHDPSSLSCPPDAPIYLVIEMMLKFPLIPGEIQRFTDLLSSTKPRKPYAFVLG